MTAWAAPDSVPVVLWQLAISSRWARTAATTTGMYSARQPAITALIAACSAVTVTSRVGTWPSTSSLSRPAAARNRSHLLGRGRHDGQAVGPAPLEVVLDERVGVGVLVARRPQHGGDSTVSAWSHAAAPRPSTEPTRSRRSTTGTSSPTTPSPSTATRSVGSRRRTLERLERVVAAGVGGRPRAVVGRLARPASPRRRPHRLRPPRRPSRARRSSPTRPPVNLHKLASAALRASPRPHGDRHRPSATSRPTGTCSRGWGRSAGSMARTPDGLADDVGLVAFSHVDYRTGAVADLAGITEAAHAAGRGSCGTSATRPASCPSTSPTHEVDLAVGATYKYLCGGPGSPAFAYVRRDLIDALRSPIPGLARPPRPVRHGADVRAGRRRPAVPGRHADRPGPRLRRGGRPRCSATPASRPCARR